jgi:hypothetical protein
MGLLLTLLANDTDRLDFWHFQYFQGDRLFSLLCLLHIPLALANENLTV